MSRNGDEDDATLRFDDKSNTNNSEESSKMRASTDAKLEDLMKRKTPKKGRKEETIMISLPITQCPSIMIICLALLPTPPYPLAKLPTLMELVITNGSTA
jgi:hypothetical protein